MLLWPGRFWKLHSYTMLNRFLSCKMPWSFILTGLVTHQDKDYRQYAPNLFEQEIF